jgi:putative membrane protein
MRHLICIMLIASIVACKSREQDKDSVKIAKEINKDKADTGSNVPMNEDTVAGTIAVEKTDANFSVEAANGGMIEIQLAALAKTKAVNQRVKNFAAMMLEDHNKINAELQRIATAKNITLPQALSDEAKKDINRLNKKEKGEFDRAYMKMMVTDHKNDVAEFERMAKDSKDPALKDFVKETLPILKKHLDSARAIDKLFLTGTREPDTPYPYYK